MKSKECPVCNSNINMVDWYVHFAKCLGDIFYFKCEHCKAKIGSTLIPIGVVSFWDKKQEIK